MQTAGDTQGGSVGGGVGVRGSEHGSPTAARGAQAIPPSPTLQYESGGQATPVPHVVGSTQIPPTMRSVQTVPVWQIPPGTVHGWPAPGAAAQVPAPLPLCGGSHRRSPVQRTAGIVYAPHGCPSPAWTTVELSTQIPPPPQYAPGWQPPLSHAAPRAATPRGWQTPQGVPPPHARLRHSVS